MNPQPSLWSLMAYGDTGFGDEFLKGLLFTLQISLSGYAVAFVLGLMGAGAKLHGNKWLYRAGDLYTTFVRAIPELLLILMVYYMGGRALTALFVGVGLAGQDFQVTPLAAAVASLGLIYGAYLTDILRGAIQAIPKGQLEAGRAYGMHAPMRFRRIIFPQMIRYAIPGMGNQWLNITKDSSLVSAIGAFEMAFAAKSAASQTKHYIFFYSIGALCFLAITIVSMVALQQIERRASRGVRRA
ncbi:MAG TPA: ABC transporter permease subunit [Dongiaceae bacterium]|jgi:His/Glu/Gln/Arg/opine family amino acid ABC transporter permease subunit|nr:ABC transporter permease subunit [Dongiaceae bacterium]